jgi:hypothetical protein
MCDFIEPALLEIFADLAAVDATLRGIHAENLTEKLKSALAVTFEIRQYFAHVKVPFRAEAARVEKKISGNRNTHDGAADIDVRKIEGLAVEGHKTPRPDLADVGPEVREQLPLIRLAVGARSIEFKPVDADADDPAGAGIQAEAFKDLLPVLVSLDIEQDLPCPRRNQLWILSDRFNVDNESCWLPHVLKLTDTKDSSGARDSLQSGGDTTLITVIVQPADPKGPAFDPALGPVRLPLRIARFGVAATSRWPDSHTSFLIANGDQEDGVAPGPA